MKNNNGLIIAGVIGAVAIGAVAYAMTSKRNDKGELLLGPDANTALTADAQARLAEAQSQQRQAELAAEVRKAELKALDKPIGDRLLDFALDTSKGFLSSLGGSIKL